LNFDKEIADIKHTVDRHDQAIVDVLKSIQKLLSENKSLLENLRKEYDAFPTGESP
jgi:hypothetical protein